MPILDFSHFPLLSSTTGDAPTPVPAVLAQIDVETTRLRFRGLDFVARDEVECDPSDLESIDALARGLRATRNGNRAELLALKHVMRALDVGEKERIRIALVAYGSLMRLRGAETELVAACLKRADELENFNAT